MNKNITFIKHATSHHAKHSGYSELLEYIPGEIISAEHPSLSYRLRKSIAACVSGSFGIYDSNSVQKDFLLAKSMLRNKDGIAHFLNGERDIRFSTYLKKMTNWKFVATFHKPPDVLRQQIQNFAYIEKLDGAIAVGINQVKFLKDKIKKDGVTFIPHGVDTEFFQPSNDEWEPYSCIFVGQHLRDFEMLAACVKLLEKHVPAFKLRAILRNDFFHLLPQKANIEILSGISDEKLRDLYRKSALLLLPLTEVTACNSILEALACGLPIVTTDLEGNRGYLDEKCSYLVERGNARAMTDAVMKLMEDKTLNKKMRNNARTQSLKFSWSAVAKLMLEYYKTHFDYN